MRVAAFFFFFFFFLTFFSGGGGGVGSVWRYGESVINGQYASGDLCPSHRTVTLVYLMIDISHLICDCQNWLNISNSETNEYHTYWSIT